MKAVNLMMPLMSLWFTFMVPAGVGLYWTMSNVMSVLQSLIMNHFWNPKEIAEKLKKEEEERRERERSVRSEPSYSSPAVDELEARRSNKVVNIRAATQLQVVLVKPERFEMASEIADHLKEKRTVVLNLEKTQKDVSRRLHAAPVFIVVVVRQKDVRSGAQARRPAVGGKPPEARIRGAAIGRPQNDGGDPGRLRSGRGKGALVF